MSSADPAPAHPQPRGGSTTGNRSLALVLLVGGIIGLAAAFALTVERFALADDPTYMPTCDINPLLSCGSVMRTWQAAVFGFPNPLLGLIGFTAVAVTGAAMLGGMRLPGWYRAGLQAGATFGVVFVHWLAFQSVYRIGALCPYCMVVWAVTIPIFLYVTLDNLGAVLPVGGRRARLVKRLQEFHTTVLTVWFLAFVAAIVIHFRESWAALL